VRTADRSAQRGQQELEGGRREGLAGVARGEHHPAQPLAVVRHDQLGEDAAGVHPDHGHPVWSERVEHFGQQVGQAARAEVGAGDHRLGVRAERQV
jgi:hypothetical protein